MYGDGRTDLNLRVLSFPYTRCLCSKGRSEVRCVAQQLHSVVRSLSHFAMQLLGPSPVLTRSRMEKRVREFDFRLLDMTMPVQAGFRDCESYCSLLLVHLHSK